MSRRRRENRLAEAKRQTASGTRRRWVTAALGVAICALLAGVVWAFARPEPTPVYGYEIVNEYPHDRDAFTQGLVYDDGDLIEGTGLERRSQLRRVELATGKVRQVVRLAPEFFGEGVAVFGDRIYQLTWKSGVGFVYDKKSLKRIGTFRYAGEGWGLATDSRHLILSDGTSVIRFFDPATFKEVGRIRVTSEGRAVDNINELEFIGGEIFANIWKQDRIARISPETGQVVGWINLAGLLPRKLRRPLLDMDLNGIAYDAEGDRLFVTGKNWPTLYEIRLKK
jgi:glutamine cyclotransferase